MNEQSENMISISTAFMLFISACIFALGLTGEINRAVDEAGRVAQGQPKSVQPALEASHDDWVSGSQVVFSIIGNNDPGVRISVDGTNVAGDPWGEGVDFSAIDTGAVYSLDYEWSGSGDLIGINFAKAGSEEKKQP
ncbi:hypothetical protein [Paenibacillus sp. XY044]|uniref:hypothetical protein n=1 Tax=Paenibacillus sp. XY044 TaxID=2026089 RepID=UPI000B99D543|nr:hypothetical protein [Paenibacillus sp. XY044]OZB95093.1 hypothetical protein CJP46_15450 [Paenibacillus sp. XY044]